ncbi:hypothetical protein TNCV_3953411 [Trichonephila clavipes]|nr:hypothetical protein TNCV_3953411 [Trichonephila clavipes]
MAKTFLDSTLTVTPHKSLNSSRGVISEPDLLCASEIEILEGHSDQSVTQKKGPKVQKPEIEIKMGPHRSRKPTPTEYATDEEVMITYDVEE